MKQFALAIHGGAGTLLPEEITPEKQQAIDEGLRAAVLAGEAILKNGGTAVEAVKMAVISLENCPLFNAGKGAVLDHEGSFELEASIMCGETGEAGAVAGVRNVKNPVALAEEVLKDGRFVMLHGEGAKDFATEKGLEIVEDEYFLTAGRQKQWEAARETGEMLVDHDGERKFGTVGAVALDMDGNLAAATSTGGLVNKQYSRLGDSAVIGAGTYADNDTCAISCTGYGEYFLRNVVAFDIAARMDYGAKSLEKSAQEVVMKKLVERGGEGGIIGLDGEGNIALVFNSAGMYRAWVKSGGEIQTAIFE
ncbi:isoaspartyl peptidase/L-asparaginase [Persicobacter diffluens]|uniref:Isoaspartyl peptidase n=1 Tax=Persicobacter diffluens TaxID=981 RepID=A0AAN4VYJ4_9BACT|nr:L-asparaginase [Persicobacter diffluens]